MVMRRLKIFVVILLPLLVAMVFLGWLLGTTAGANWTIGRLSAWSSVKIQTAGIEGRIAGHLQIDGVVATLPAGHIHSSRIVWKLKPAKLFAGILHWSDLSLHDVVVDLPEPTLSSPDKPPAKLDLERLRQIWPGWLSWFEFRLDEMQIDDLVVRQYGTSSFHLDNLQIGINWVDGQLKMNLTDLLLPEGNFSAEISLVPDSLTGKLSLTAKFKESWNRIKSVETNWDFMPLDKRSVQVTGDIILGGTEEVLFNINTQSVLTGQELRIEQFLARQPSRRGVFDLAGRVNWTNDVSKPIWVGRGDLNNLDLTGWRLPVALTGTIDAEGVGDDYGGQFKLLNSNQQWLVKSLDGHFHGTRSSVTFKDLDGELLQGVFTGAVETDWAKDLQLQLELQGRQINPFPAVPNVEASLDLDLRGSLSRQKSGDVWDVETRLLSSLWRGQTVSGFLLAAGLGDDVRIEQLQLQGDGLRLQVSGVLNDRIDSELQVAQLSHWWPELSGNGSVQGWLKWQKGKFAGELQGYLKQFTAPQVRIEKFQFRAGMKSGFEDVDLSLLGSGIAYRESLVNDFKFDLTGSRQRHQALFLMSWASGSLRSRLSGGWEKKTWQAEIKDLDLDEKMVGTLSLTQPSSLIAGRQFVQIPNLKLQSETGEKFELSADLTLVPLAGTGRVFWRNVSLQRVNPWTPFTLNGSSDGTFEVTLSENRITAAQIATTASFKLRKDQPRLADALLRVNGSWGEAGIELNNNLQLSGGGDFSMHISSSEDVRFLPPRQGQVLLEWNELPLELAQVWLPPKIQLNGLWQGAVRGGWHDRQRLRLELDSQIKSGEVSWHDIAGKLVAAEVEGQLNGKWAEDSLFIAADMDLSDQGRLESAWTLPLSSRYPFKFRIQEPWQGNLTLMAREKGLLAFIFPGLLEETKGNIDLHLATGGSPSDPRFSGKLTLQDAAGNLPALGIRLDDIDFQVRLADDHLHIEQLSLVSGQGNLQAKGVFELDGWELSRQQWTLQGKEMPLVNLPELELYVSPDLTGKGSGKMLGISGHLLIPRMKLRSISARGQLPVSSSSDVFVVDAASPRQRVWPLDLDARIRLDLGDAVLVNTAGVDARLSGGVDLVLRGPRDVTGSGVISVAQGTYAGYGLRLPIERGRILFSGGPLDRPSLDILALKTVGEVKAGVKITGTPRFPLVELYSKPAMPDTDILAYIVLGRPLGADGGQVDMLMLAAGALLSRGESATLQDSLQRRFGLDVVQVNAGEGDVAQSVVTIGKYLRPDLYVSLGYSVFTQTNEVRLRYNLSENWELQSNTGVESGADLYYRIEFE